MRRWLARFALKRFGWKTDGNVPEGIRKAIIVAAPHTSYWDFVIGRLTYYAIRVNIRFLIKKEAFHFPLGLFLKWLGGVPVDRGKYKNNMIMQVMDLFQKYDSIYIVITPEGTRKRVARWKKGFYLMAMEAGVPIALSFVDYGNKTGGIGPVFYPCGNYEDDIQVIREFYKDKTPLHPERFSLTI
jgi:1-acyl-sn-glycerol-3-phosphate acyltransferase